MIASFRHSHGTKLALAAFVSLLVTSQFSFAATYFVGPNGSDSRSSAAATNRSTPWRSIQRGLDTAGAGDSVVVLAGTYYQHVQFRRGGNSNGELILRSEVRNGAKLIGSISGYYTNYIRIENFDVTNPGDAQLTKGISLLGCHHVSVRSNRVHDCYGGGISIDKSDWILVEWNLVNHNAFNDINQHSGISIYQPQYRGNDSRTYGIIIRNNTSYGNWNYVNNPNWGRPTDGNGIVLDDFLNQQAGGGTAYNRMTLVENNLCFGNGGQGIHNYLSQNVRIRNNTCVNNMGSFDFGGEISIVSSNRIYAYNNILVARSGKKAALQYQSYDYWVGYNVVDGPTQGLGQDNSNYYGPAAFIPGTFELEAYSPAVNSGLNMGDHFFLDVRGSNRLVGAIDRGASERQ
ncbi:MAG: right-handed parallel beta-helix repeat-containing protein [Pirellulaceae bacterium]